MLGSSGWLLGLFISDFYKFKTLNKLPCPLEGAIAMHLDWLVFWSMFSSYMWNMNGCCDSCELQDQTSWNYFLKHKISSMLHTCILHFILLRTVLLVKWVRPIYWCDVRGTNYQWHSTSGAWCALWQRTEERGN